MRVAWFDRNFVATEARRRKSVRCAGLRWVPARRYFPYIAQRAHMPARTRNISFNPLQRWSQDFRGENGGDERGHKNITPPPAPPKLSARKHRRKLSGPIICPDDDRKYPSRQQWSELPRDDCMAAERASHPIPPSKFSLSWQARLAA